MFVSVKKKDNSRWQVQIVESVRRDGKVKQRRVRGIGTAYSEKELGEFVRIGEAAIVQIKNAKKPVLSFVDPFEVHRPAKRKRPIEELVDPHDLREEKRINEGFCDVFGTLYEKCGFQNMIQGSRRDGQWNAILESVVMARIADPSSKKAAASLLAEDFDIKTPVEKIYRMMDHLHKHELKLKQQVASSTLGLFENKVDVLFFDVTTLYFESTEVDELRSFGFSKDCKFKESQVVLALVTTASGLPITYKLFPGNMYEGHTLLAMIGSLKKDFKIDNVLLVADRAMFTNDNLSLMDREGIKYIVAAKLRQLDRGMRDRILNTVFKPDVISDEFIWTGELDHQGRRLIVSYSSARARKDAADRERLLQRLKNKEKEGLINVKELIPNYGSKKFLKVINNKAAVSEEKIAADSEWDGLHGVITNHSELSVRSILERYRGLWQIEEAFRVNKHSLKMRPIFHWTPRRISSHIMICFLAFALVKQALFRLRARGLGYSFEQLRHHLEKTQSSILIDRRTKKRYVLPSKTTEDQQLIYAAFGLQRTDRPYGI